MPAENLFGMAILIFSHIKRQHRQMLGGAGCSDGIKNRSVKERTEEELLGFFQFQDGGYLFDWGQQAN